MRVKKPLPIPKNFYSIMGLNMYSWIRLLLRNFPLTQGWLRILGITSVTMMFAPVRVAHQLMYAKKFRKTIIKEDPIFIIGFYRSGTTFLQNVITQDPQWGNTSMLQACFPKAFLFRDYLFEPILSRVSIKSKERAFDSVEQSFDYPTETDLAIANLTYDSNFFQGLHFPLHLKKCFDETVLFKDLSPDGVQRWKDLCLQVLKTSTYANEGKRLLVKNPPDMCRIPVLLEMFPNAKFIFTYRNPFFHFFSLKNLLLFFQSIGFNSVSDSELNNIIIYLYKEAVNKYLKDKHLIPTSNLYEMKYENFVKNPLKHLDEIYSKFDFDASQSKLIFSKYLEKLSSYQKTKHNYKEEELQLIRTEWDYMFEMWDYKKEI